MVEMEVRKVTKGVESNMVAFDFERTPITQIADYIIITASNNGTSDIHFDPREDGMMVRFRIDGDLQDYTYIPKIYERNLSTRLKLLANMNITESRLPQDGAIKGEFGGKYLDMRVSCLPLNTGEKIVIRILDYSRSLQGIDNLGFNETNLKKIKRMMGVPNGIILITGATGSGKSTTVYSILQGLNKPEINIITVEDPIEMNIEGMNQVQVNAEIGMTFAAALRSILRQDPNVILIGEIRDSETAQIAVRASITGHLVLSTIHTNNSLATIERLLDMDVERYLLSTALTGIVSQRLAKQLCMECRVERETTKYEKKVFKKFMKRDIDKLYDANPKGCEHCRKGYKGRIAIHEVLELDDTIRNAIANTKLKKEELSEMVYNGNTISMLQDALGKAISGLTSFEEVYRVIELESDPEDDTAYLTRSLDDDEDDKQNQPAATGEEDLDGNITTPQKQPTTVVEPLKSDETNKVEATQQPKVETPKFNEKGVEIKDIKELTKNLPTPPAPNAKPATQPQQAQPVQPMPNQQPQQVQPGQPMPQTTQMQKPQVPPVQQTPAKAQVPQAVFLTPEQAKAQADALATKKAQADAIKKQEKKMDSPVTLLTPEQAKIQAEAAKLEYDIKKTEENERKILQVISKPGPQKLAKKKKLVVANPNITPTPISAEQAIPKKQVEKVENKVPESNLYQLPKSSAPTPTKVEQPKVPEKMEKEIPELKIKINTTQDKPLIPTIDESPLIQEENTFDEKNKVSEVDIKKISKSTDLKKDEQISEKPLLPTIKNEAKKNEGIVPIIIDSFDVDKELKDAPKLNEITKENIKDNKAEDIPKIVKNIIEENSSEPTSILNMPVPKITKIIETSVPTTPSIPNREKDETKTTSEKTDTQKIVQEKPVIKKIETPKEPIITKITELKEPKKDTVKEEAFKVVPPKEEKKEEPKKVTIKEEAFKVVPPKEEKKEEPKKVTIKEEAFKVVPPKEEKKEEPKKVTIKEEAFKVVPPKEEKKEEPKKVTIKEEAFKVVPPKEEKKEEPKKVTIKEEAFKVVPPKEEKKEEPKKVTIKEEAFKVVPPKEEKKEEPKKETKEPQKTLVKPIAVTKAKTTANETKKIELPSKKVEEKEPTPLTESVKDKNKAFELPVITETKKEMLPKEEKKEEQKEEIFKIAPPKKEEKKEEPKKEEKIEHKPFITEMKPNAFKLPDINKSEKKRNIEKTEEKTARKPFITEMKTNVTLPDMSKPNERKTNSIESKKEEKKTRPSKFTLPDIIKEAEEKVKEAIELENKKNSTEEPKEKKVSENTEVLDLDIDGELTALGED